MNNVEGRQLLPGYDWMNWLDRMLFDLDSPHGDLRLAHKEAITLLDHLTKLVGEHNVQVYFTGGRGFHILMNVHPLNAGYDEPVIKDHVTANAFAVTATRHLGLMTVDLGIYTKHRLVRKPDTRNPRTGLYKARISNFTLRSRQLSDILAMAQPDRYKAQQADEPSECHYCPMMARNYINGKHCCSDCYRVEEGV